MSMWRKVWLWKRSLKKGTTYCLRWRDDTGRLHTEAVGTDKKVANAARTQREMELNRSKYGIVKRVPYNDFVEEELAILRGRVAPRTVEQYDITFRHFDRLCNPDIVADISVPMIELFSSSRVQEVRNVTVNKDLRNLKAALGRAVKRAYIKSNPVKEVALLKEPEKTIRVLTPGEVAALLKACPSVSWRAFVATAVSTGLRRGELMALRWQDLDLKTGTLWVRNTPDHETKTGKERVLSLSDELIELLRGVPRHGDHVFSDGDCNMRLDSLSAAFRRIVEDSGIKHCTMHDLRRTFVSQLAMADVNQAIVQQLAGHSTITTTAKYYTGIMPDALRSAQMRLPFGDVIAQFS